MSGGFADLGLLPELLQAVDDQGWLLPTDIQDEAIPLILGGGDVMGAAETGSGKTAAFALPIIQAVYERLKEPASTQRARIDVSTPAIRLNDQDRDPEIDLHSDGLTCSYSGTDKWLGVRATHGVKSGAFYFETVVRGSGNCRVGWSTRLAHLDLGKDRLGFGYGAKSFKSFDGAYEKYGEVYTEGDVIGSLLDLDQRTARFSKNGKLFDVACSIPMELIGSVFFPTICLSGSMAELNLGQTAPLLHLPAGYEALHTATSVQLFSGDSSEAFAVHGRKPLALIIEPTRDLAEQVYQSILALSCHLTDPPLRIALLIGDDPRSAQASKQMLTQEGVDIVIGTLGKLTGSVASRQLDLSHIRFFVLDEADRMVAADNLSAVKGLYAHCPTAGAGIHRLQVCFFSATLHDPTIRQLADTICLNPTWIDLKGQDTTLPQTLHHAVCPIAYSEATYQCLVMGTGATIPTDGVHVDSDFAGNAEAAQCVTSQRIKEMKAALLPALIDAHRMGQVMVFCRTNLDCQTLERFLQAKSHGRLLHDKLSCAVLGGMMSMEDRRRNLQRFKDGEVRVLLCTDVAARGIDVDSLPFVINFTLPDEPQDYVHRVGRAGRADRMGLAISLVATEAKEKVWYHTCNKPRGLGCTNRKLKDKGGCTVWYDEAAQLTKVEKLLGLGIPVMDAATLELPEELKALNARYGESAAEAVLLGDSRVYMTDKMIGTVRTLAELEMKAQNLYLNLHHLRKKSRVIGQLPQPQEGEGGDVMIVA